MKKFSSCMSRARHGRLLLDFYKWTSKVQVPPYACRPRLSVGRVSQKWLDDVFKLGREVIINIGANVEE